MAKIKIDPILAAALNAYVIALDALMRSFNKRAFPKREHDPVIMEIRKRYAKVMHGDEAYSWVDLSNGNVLKGTWKGPERAVIHIARGNVLDGSWLGWHGPYGIGYADNHGQFRSWLTDGEYMVALDALKAGDAAGASTVLTAAIGDSTGGAS